MKDIMYFIKNNSIILLSIVIFTAFTLLYVLFKEPSNDQYTTVLSSEKKVDESNTNKKEYTGNNPKEAADIKYISELFKSNPDKYKNIVITNYTIIKESSDYRVADVTVRNNTKASYTERVLFKGSAIISGINNHHQAGYLKNIGVPNDIITLYVKSSSNA